MRFYLQDAAILFPKEVQDLSIQANDAILQSIQDYKQVSSKSQALSDECERLKLEILNFMGHAEKLTHGSKTLATWKCAKASKRIDTKALALAHPDIALAHTTTVLGSRRFLLKDASWADTNSISALKNLNPELPNTKTPGKWKKILKKKEYLKE